VLDDGFELVDDFLQFFSVVDVVVVDVQHRVVQFLSHYYWFRKLALLSFY
jgi:hypothetical protein